MIRKVYALNNAPLFATEAAVTIGLLRRGALPNTIYYLSQGFQ
jgi:hypothetical protein